MIKYDNDYYKKVISNYKYDYVSSFPKITDNEFQEKWLCSYNLNEFLKGFSLKEKSIIIMGIGINGVPHLGTVSQILKAITLQKHGYFVEIILGDLDVYGARAKPIKEVLRLVKKYKNFIINMGFDVKKGILRNQYDYDNILKTSFLISSVIRDKDFVEVEEEINELYKTERVYNGMEFNVKQSILLMFADFIHHGYFEKYKHVLIMSGIDEHGYVWKANEIKNRLGINMTISGLYSKMLRGLNNYPKMSKSLNESTINLECRKRDIINIINSENNDYDNANNSFVFQLISQVSLYDIDFILKTKENCNCKNYEWELAKKKYINDLWQICKNWK